MTEVEADAVRSLRCLQADAVITFSDRGPLSCVKVQSREGGEYA